MRLAIGVIFMLVSIYSHAQQLQTANCKTVIGHNGYFYFPSEFMEDSVDCLMLSHDSTFSTTQSTTIVFYWISPCNDGYFEINITPEQIYFSSAHDNPNPNFLFWAMDIDSVLYPEILAHLNNDCPPGFKNGYRKNLFFDSSFTSSVIIPEDWTDSLEHKFYTDCGLEELNQLNRYFEVINGLMSKTGLQFNLPPRSMLYGTQPKMLADQYTILPYKQKK